MSKLDDILEDVGRLYIQYIDETTLYEGASWGGKLVDEQKQRVRDLVLEIIDEEDKSGDTYSPLAEVRRRVEKL